MIKKGKRRVYCRYLIQVGLEHTSILYATLSVGGGINNIIIRTNFAFLSTPVPLRLSVSPPLGRTPERENSNLCYVMLISIRRRALAGGTHLAT